jgi:lipopolysaccharide transport system permease protein
MGLIGLAWILSLVTVVFRDLEHLLTAILVILLVASPIAYTPEMVPDNVRLLLYLNPFALVVLAYQKVMLLGELPGLDQTLGLVALSLGLFLLGSLFFAWAKRLTLDYV